MGEMEIPDELIDQLLGDYKGPEQLTGPDGLINQLRKRLIERAAGAELEQHLGYPPGDAPPEGQTNRRKSPISLSSWASRWERRRCHSASMAKKDTSPRVRMRTRRIFCCKRLKNIRAKLR